MTIESATTINELDATKPGSNDLTAEGDDHLRLIKAAIKATFANVTGAVTMTHTQLNSIPNLATLASPALTGTPTVPTASQSTSTTQAASTQFVQQAIAAVNAQGTWYSPKYYSAVGDGISDDTTAFTAMKAVVDNQVASVVNFSGGRYSTTGTFWDNNVSPTAMTFDKASVLGCFDGTDAQPNAVDNDPAIWAQKYTKFDNGTNRFAHEVGGVFGSVVIKGSGTTGATDTDGTWIAMLGNAALKGTNQGSAAAPDFDAYGNTIGVAGFSHTTGYPGDGNIVCGVWGYAEGPTLDATTYANLPATNWSLVGHEVNVQINHPDLGTKTLLVGKGSSAGGLYKNYRTPGTGVMDWTFGAVFDGTPSDNNYLGADVSLWSGFYTGILIDKIKSRGILFGKYAATGSYGIEFPDSYAGFAQRPAAAMYVGDNVINMAQYTGATFNNSDLWHNAGYLYFRYGGQNERVLTSRAGEVRLDATEDIVIGSQVVARFASTGDFLAGGALGAEAFRAVYLASAVNRTQVRGAVTGDAVVYGAEGSDATVPIEYRSKGAARQFWTINSVEVGQFTSAGNFTVNTVGAGLRVKEGSNAKQGTATLVAGHVVVANTSVTAASRIFLTSQVDGGTPGFLRVSSRVAGTSFTVDSSNGADTSTVAYQIFEPA
jgi:hypothetical protein